MARFEWTAKGWFPLPHPSSGVAIVPEIRMHAAWRGCNDAPDAGASRYMARRYCERVIGMRDVIVTKCVLTTRTAE